MVLVSNPSAINHTRSQQTCTATSSKNVTFFTIFGTVKAKENIIETLTKILLQQNNHLHSPFLPETLPLERMDPLQNRYISMTTWH
jgi:hypothetical protein